MKDEKFTHLNHTLKVLNDVIEIQGKEKMLGLNHSEPPEEDEDFERINSIVYVDFNRKKNLSKEARELRIKEENENKRKTKITRD